jgi:hypothetical protein
MSRMSWVRPPPGAKNFFLAAPVGFIHNIYILKELTKNTNGGLAQMVERLSANRPICQGLSKALTSAEQLVLGSSPRAPLLFFGGSGTRLPSVYNKRLHTTYKISSTIAQRKSVWLITRRSVDRNHLVLFFFLPRLQNKKGLRYLRLIFLGPEFITLTK